MSKYLRNHKRKQVAEWLEENLEEALGMYELPQEDRKRMKSTNMLERLNQELKRRSRVVRIFPNEASCLTTYWDNKRLEQFFNPVLLWQKQFNIPSSQILVGEFGCDRTAQGANQYLSHLISIFNRNNWHWAFYSFREDCWDSMDYELGSGDLHWQYWDTAEKSGNLDRFRKNNPIFDVIKKALENSSN